MGSWQLKKFRVHDLQGSGDGLYRSGTTKYNMPREKETSSFGVDDRRAITDVDKSTLVNIRPLDHVMMFNAAFWHL